MTSSARHSTGQTTPRCHEPSAGSESHAQLIFTASSQKPKPHHSHRHCHHHPMLVTLAPPWLLRHTAGLAWLGRWLTIVIYFVMSSAIFSFWQPHIFKNLVIDQFSKPLRRPIIVFIFVHLVYLYVQFHHIYFTRAIFVLHVCINGLLCVFKAVFVVLVKTRVAIIAEGLSTITALW